MVDCIEAYSIALREPSLQNIDGFIHPLKNVYPVIRAILTARFGGNKFKAMPETTLENGPTHCGI